MQKKETKKSIAIAAMCVLSVGVIMLSETSRKWGAVAVSGTPVDISSMNADSYQVNEVLLTDDGNYIVKGKAKGFASDIETAVTFDATGSNILSLAVLSQGETNGLGSRITEDDFLSQFNNIPGPIKVADLEVASPVTGSVSTASGETTEVTAENYSSADWNPEDQSPEANAVRNLYNAGLLESAKSGESLTTALVDLSPEAQAVHNLYDAGLLESAKNGESLSMARADLSPEEKALAELKDANLLVKGEETASGNIVTTITEVDAISGATISSKAVGTTINNAYFFLNESVLK